MSGESGSEGAPPGDPKPAADPAEERAQKLVGTVIADRYRIHNVLAMGGMGAVFTGEHVHMRKRVAIKVLHPDTEGLPGLVARFEREAIVGAHVEHKNIASARDFGRMSDGSYYLVLEFVRGLTLRQLMRQGPVPVRRAVGIARQIAHALGKVHAKGIIHRDINPRNVMVIPGTKDQVKIIDFGFAKVPVEKFTAMSIQRGTPVAPSQITGDGVIFGTIGFLAPEAAAGMKMVDKRSDLYALGSIFYEMLCGEPPFVAPTQATLYLKHRVEPVPPMKERAPNVEVPESLEAIARKLLAKEPADRFQKADEVVHALDDALESIDVEDIPVEFEEPASTELTVAGADDPVSLPRFEDVAGGGRRAASIAPGPKTKTVRPLPPVEREAETTSAQIGPSARSVRAPSETQKSSRRSSGSSWPIWVLVLAVVGVGGTFAWTRFGKSFFGRQEGEASAEATATPAPSAKASSSVPSASSTAPQPPLSASAKPRPADVDGLNADAWRGVVRQAQSSRDWARAGKGILALGELDPAALAGAEMKSATVEVVVNAGPGQTANLVRALADDFESDGVDVLYDLITTRGGSEASSISDELLRKPEVLARATPALRIALELRRAACNDKPALLDRAVQEGDQRTLSIIAPLRDPKCDVTTGACCLNQNPAVEKAVMALTNRLQQH